MDYPGIISTIIALIMVAAALYFRPLRKTIGLLLVILGAIVCFTIIGMVICIKMKMTTGFWNEIVGEREIIFIFKFKDGKIKEYKLSPANEQEISDLCESFNDEPPRKAANVYKYISENKFITILCLNTTRV